MGRPIVKPLTPRVRRMLEAFGLPGDAPLGALAEALQAPYGTVANWQKRDAVPDKWLYRTAELRGVSVEWLKTGDEPVQLGRSSKQLNRTLSAERFAGHTPSAQVFVGEPEALGWMRASLHVPELDLPKARERRKRSERALLPVQDSERLRPLVMTLAATSGAGSVDYEVIPQMMGFASAGPISKDKGPMSKPPVIDRAGECAFSFEWLSRNLHHTTGDIVTVQVTGDSMSPTLVDGDTIMVDRGVKEIEADGIYVIHLGGRRLVKRIQRKYDGTLVIISDHQAYERETIAREHAQAVVVLGRMVWRMVP